MKSILKLYYKSLVFVVLVIGLFYLLNPIFVKDTIWKNFYNQEKNSVDVLILGNSHANLGLDLNIINSKLKAKTVSLATKGQNIYQAYYCALEAYNYQTPEILIIENFLFYERLTIDKFINQDASLGDYKKRYLSFDGKKIGKAKIQEANRFFKTPLIQNIFPVIQKHNDWTKIDEIKERFFKSNNKQVSNTTILNKNKVQQYKQTQKFDLMRFNVLPDEEKYLDSIVDLALKKGTKHIVFLTIPFYNEYRNKIDYSSLEKPLITYAKKDPKITYLDLNQVFPDLNYTYFSNDNVGYNQHLNYKGAIKTSQFLSDYIAKNYNFKLNNSFKEIPEYYLYNEIKRDSLENGYRILGNMERLNGTKQRKYIIKQGESPLVLQGWMALENQESKRSEMFIGLKGDNSNIYVSKLKESNIKIRKDVSKFFKKENIYDNSGFKININSLLLEKGKYEVFMIIRNSEDEVLVRNSKKRIEII